MDEFQESEGNEDRINLEAEVIESSEHENEAIIRLLSEIGDLGRAIQSMTDNILNLSRDEIDWRSSDIAGCSE